MPRALIGGSAGSRDVPWWKPQVTFEQLICDMVDAGLRRHRGQVN